MLSEDSHLRKVQRLSKAKQPHLQKCINDKIRWFENKVVEIQHEASRVGFSKPEVRGFHKIW